MSKPDENLRLVAIRDEDTGRVFQEFMDSDIVNLMVTFGGMEENEIGEADADGDDDEIDFDSAEINPKMR